MIYYTTLQNNYIFFFWITNNYYIFSHNAWVCDKFSIKEVTIFVSNIFQIFVTHNVQICVSEYETAQGRNRSGGNYNSYWALCRTCIKPSYNLIHHMFGLMEVHIFMSTGLNWNNTIKFINIYKLVNKIFWNRH